MTVQKLSRREALRGTGVAALLPAHRWRRWLAPLPRGSEPVLARLNSPLDGEGLRGSPPFFKAMQANSNAKG